jgi:hypothetical protein
MSTAVSASRLPSTAVSANQWLPSTTVSTSRLLPSNAISGRRRLPLTCSRLHLAIIVRTLNEYSKMRASQGNIREASATSSRMKSERYMYVLNGTERIERFIKQHKSCSKSNFNQQLHLDTSTSYKQMRL